MIDPELDEHSMMTYLAQFCSCASKEVSTRIPVLYTCVTRGFQNRPQSWFPLSGKNTPKREFRAILPPYIPLFWSTCLVEFKKWPLKAPLIESKRTLFLANRHILTPNRDSRESHSASKNNPFLRFSGRACVQHYHSSDPPGVLCMRK